MNSFLRKLFGIDNPLGVFYGRLIIGLVLASYGFLIFFLNSIENQWTRISIAMAFWSMGLMFIFDARTILKEYYETDKKVTLPDKKEASILPFLKLVFLGGSIIFLVKFYFAQNPSFYPLTILLIAIILIIVFNEKISHFQISKDGVLIKMMQDINKSYSEIDLKKKDWNFKIEEVKNVRQRKNKKIL